MTWCSMLCSFFWGVVFRRFEFYFFNGKSSCWSILRLCKFIQNGRNTNFTKKWKHDLYGQFPMEFKVLKLWKSSTWPKIGIIRRASVSTLEKMYHLEKWKIRGLILLGFPLCLRVARSIRIGMPHILLPHGALNVLSLLAGVVSSISDFSPVCHPPLMGNASFDIQNTVRSKPPQTINSKFCLLNAKFMENKWRHECRKMRPVPMKCWILWNCVFWYLETRFSSRICCASGFCTKLRAET